MSAADQVQLDNFQSIFSLDGKVAVVTGGSRGLGLHAASGYALHHYYTPFHPTKKILKQHCVASSKPAARKST
jgi:hypothetical protein